MDVAHKARGVFMSDEYSKYSMKVGLNAFTNPTTNSYKRLIPGFEAPVMLAYSARNRTASIRIPHTSTMNSKRIEARFPDAAANPYFAFAAMLMAGLDGIENKIHPSDPHEGNLYDPKISHGIPQVASSLDQALSALDQDRNFLKKVAFLRMILSMILLSLRKKKFTPLTIRRNQLNLKCIMVCRLCEARRK